MKIYQKRRYHEWRWQKLVGPLVDKDGTDRTLLDLGCNAGFYMRKAQKLGYRTFGVEVDPDYISQASGDLDIVQADINYYTPRCAYITLLCCVHYHQSLEQVDALLHNLMYSTVYLLVMGRHRGDVKSPPDKGHLMERLNGWKAADSRNVKQFYTVLVKSPMLEEFGVDDLYESTGDFVSGIEGFDNFVPAFEDFVRRTLDDINFDPSGSDLMNYFSRRELRYPLGRCWKYKVMIKELQQNGINEALRVTDNRIKDGYHRLIVLRELGYKRVVCRKV